MNPYVEIMKMAVGIVFTLINQGKLTPEDFEVEVKRQTEYFRAHPPDTLPDVK